MHMAIIEFTAVMKAHACNVYLNVCCIIIIIHLLHIVYCPYRALAAEQDLGVPRTWSVTSTPDHAAGRGPREALHWCQECSVLSQPGPG